MKLMIVLAALFYGAPAKPDWPPTVTMTECHDIAGYPQLLKFTDGVIRPVCITPAREWYLLKLELN